MRKLLYLLTSLFCYNGFSQTQTNDQALKTFSLENNLTQGEYNYVKNYQSTPEEQPINIRQQAAVCYSSNVVNIGFESGNFTGWEISGGFNLNMNPDSIIMGQTAPVTTLIAGGTDQYSGINLVSPLGGTQIVKMNNSLINGGATILKTKFQVTNSTKFLKTAFAAVFQSAGHTCNKNPYFKIEIFNCNETVKLSEYYTLAQEGSCTGSSFLSIINSTTIASPWRIHCFDFSNYLNSNITLKVSVADCPFNGHFGYAYFDAAFAALVGGGLNYNYSINGTSYNFANGNTNCYNMGDMFANPVSATSYSAYSQPPTFTSSAQSFSLVNGGNLHFIYDHALNNCYQQQKITIGVTPTISAATTPTVVCPYVTFYLNATGANTYSFFPSGVSTSSSSPKTASATVIYTLVGTGVGNCTDTTTVQMNIFPQTTVTISPATQTVCSGTSAFLSASGVGSYTWSTGQLGYSITVSPTITTTNYNVYGKDNNNCSTQSAGQASVYVVPTYTNMNISPSTSICPGDSVFASANGQGITGYLWSNGVTTNTVYLKPLSTTVYTLTGFTNCANIVKTITVTVKPITTFSFSVSSPTTVCENVNFTVNSNGATTYTYIGAITNTNTGTGSIFVPLSANNFTVIAKSLSNCSTSSSVIPLTVNPTPTVSALPQSICQGNTVTLTASGASSYTWMNSSLVPIGTGSSFTITPTGSANYYVSGSNSFGCSNMTSAMVTVQHSALFITASSNTVCLSNNSVTLSPIWSMNTPTTYTWNNSVPSASYVVTPTITTTYTLDANNSVCGMMYATQTITVYPSYGPTLNVAINPLQICKGQSLTYSASGAMTYNYPFYGLSGNGNLNVPVNTIFSGTISVIGYDNFGCKTISPSFSIDVVAQPTVNILASSTICPTTAKTLTATGAASYSWSTGALSNTVTVSPGVNTTYTVKGYSSLNACSVSAVKTIYVYSVTPTVIIGQYSVCPGALNILGVNNPSAVNYTWSTGSNWDTTKVFPSVPTVYSVTTLDYNGCKSSASFSVGMNSLPNVTISAQTFTNCVSNGPITFTPSPAGGQFTPVTYSSGIALNSPGIHIIKYKYYNVCTNTTSVTYTVYANPCVSMFASQDSICQGQSSNLNTFPTGGIITGPYLTGTNFTPQVSGLFNFNYSYTNSNGCSSQACSSVFVDICTGIEKKSADNFFNVYPNPFSHSFKVIIENEETAFYYLLDVNSKVLHNGSFVKETELNFPHIKDGIYFLRIQQGSLIKGIKVIKN